MIIGQSLTVSAEMGYFSNGRPLIIPLARLNFSIENISTPASPARIDVGRLSRRGKYPSEHCQGLDTALDVNYDNKIILVE